MTKVRLLVIAFLASIAAMGCSKNPHAPAKISGALTYKGTPIKGGSMSLVGSDGIQYPVAISTDGTYSATDIPEGELVVVIETESINPGRKAGPQSKDTEKRMNMVQQKSPNAGSGPAANPTEHYIKIPEKYSKASTSTMSVVVKSGRNVKDIDLTD